MADLRGSPPAKGCALERCRVLLAPGQEVLHTFETLPGLRELQHRVVMVDLVGDVVVLALVLPMTSQGAHQCGLVEHYHLIGATSINSSVGAPA